MFINLDMCSLEFVVQCGLLERAGISLALVLATLRSSHADICRPEIFLFLGYHPEPDFEAAGLGPRQ